MIDLPDILRWNAANHRARQEYYAHPIASCIIAGCYALADYICGRHRREATQRAQAKGRGA